jgi:hypothetical protein
MIATELIVVIGLGAVFPYVVEAAWDRISHRIER